MNMSRFIVVWYLVSSLIAPRVDGVQVHSAHSAAGKVSSRSLKIAFPDGKSVGAAEAAVGDGSVAARLLKRKRARDEHTANENPAAPSHPRGHTKAADRPPKRKRARIEQTTGENSQSTVVTLNAEVVDVPHAHNPECDDVAEKNGEANYFYYFARCEGTKRTTTIQKFTF